MGASLYEFSGNSFDSLQESAKCSPLYDNSLQSNDLGCNRPFDSTACDYLPAISIGDTSPAAADLVQSERVNDALNRLFSPAYASQRSTIDGYDDPGTFSDSQDGQITQKSVDQWLNEAAAYPETRTVGGKNSYMTVETDKAERYPADLVQSLTALSDLWNSDAANAVKNDSGNITAESFDAGKPVLDSNIPTEPVGVQSDPEAPLATDDTANSADSPNDLYNALAEATTVQPGEGPYQSAQRLLALDGQAVDHKDALALAHALGQQYTCDQQVQGASGDLAGLKVNTQLLTAENVSQVLSRIDDDSLRQRLEAILGQGGTT